MQDMVLADYSVFCSPGQLDNATHILSSSVCRQLLPKV